MNSLMIIILVVNFGSLCHGDINYKLFKKCGQSGNTVTCKYLEGICMLEPEFEEYELCLRPSKLGSTCSENKDCKAIIGGKCSENSTCVCRHHFAEYNDYLCVKKRLRRQFDLRRIDDYVCDVDSCELPADYQSETRLRRESVLMYGEKCHSEDDCKKYSIPLMGCINGECRCPPDFEFDHQFFGCQRSLTSLWNNRNDDEGCNQPGMYRDDYGTCRCKQHYYRKNSFCELDPYFECPEGHYFDPTKQTCSRYAQAIDDYCGISEGCSQVNINKTVCREFKCQCPEDHIIINGSCFLPVWGKCKSDEDCTVSNSKCKPGRWSIKRCYCSDSHYASTNRTRCLPIGNEVSDPCENNEGCNGFENLRCNGTNCVCKESFATYMNQCSSILGSYCNSTSENPCQVLNSHCLDNVCQCLEDSYYESSDKLTCLPYTRRIGGHCFDNSTCRNLPHTKCSENRCVCTDDFVVNKEICMATIGGECDNDFDCGVEGSICDVTKVCKCATGFQVSGDRNKCLPNNIVAVDGTNEILNSSIILV